MTTKHTITLAAAITFAALSAQAQNVAPQAREQKTPLGTFTLESSTPVSKKEIQYTEKTFTTSDGGTATYLVNNEAEERQAQAAAVASAEEQVTVYPNPSKGVFDLRITMDDLRFKNIEIEVTNVLGEIVYHSELLTPNSELNLSSQSKGMYFYKITDENGIVATGKLIINQPYE